MSENIEPLLLARNPTEEAERRSPRLALLRVLRTAIALLTGGDLSPGPSCTMCMLGDPADLKEAVRVGLAAAGVEGEIMAEDLEGAGRLGPFGERAVLARAAENDAEYGLAYDVRAFHKRFGQALRSRPEAPTEEEARHRARLMTEEYLEFMDAIFPDSANLSYVRSTLRAVCDETRVRVDLPALEDALTDIDYISEGTRATIGTDRAKSHRAVQAANMAKEPVLDPDGKPDPLAKPTKPEGWKAPDMAEILREQGWAG